MNLAWYTHIPRLPNFSPHLLFLPLVPCCIYSHAVVLPVLVGIKCFEQLYSGQNVWSQLEDYLVGKREGGTRRGNSGERREESREWRSGWGLKRWRSAKLQGWVGQAHSITWLNLPHWFLVGDHAMSIFKILLTTFVGCLIFCAYEY